VGPASQWARVGQERVGDVGAESDATGSAHWPPVGKSLRAGEGQRGAVPGGKYRVSV
jgi:hypothetical protein